MSKKTDQAKNVLVFEVDPTECPFREFRDNELHPDYWGLGPAAFRAAIISKITVKPPADQIWVDDQTQPLPRSVRQYLHGWVRAEDLATERWGAETVVFEENNGGKMSPAAIQLSHAQVVMRSSFCRKVLSACFIMEKIDGLPVEHQWENFVFNIAPEGWRARYHIYSPGMKTGGGQQHRPGLSKNGCYLVRLFYLGAWRCVWVSDQVPVDATGSPLLPFSPLINHNPVAKAMIAGPKQPPPPAVISVNVHLWPLLICKALLKLAVPDMNADEELDRCEDELMSNFDVFHALTGSVTLTYRIPDSEDLWNHIITEVPLFGWDDDDETVTGTIKSKNSKKPVTKDTSSIKKKSMTTILIEDSKNYAPHHLPGITPAHKMDLLVSMARDLPLKKPLPEPDVALWKTYRWVDWARKHGLYEAYDCPRLRFLKVTGLMKSSYAPHLLDVQSTESITYDFRDQQEKTNPIAMKKGAKDVIKPATGDNVVTAEMKEELREWIIYDSIHLLVNSIQTHFFPSMYEFTSAGSAPPIRITKAPINRAIDIISPKSSPLYLQVDGPEENVVKISLSMLHPRVLLNAGIPMMDEIEDAYLIVEKFDWFLDSDLPKVNAFVQTSGYDTVEVKFPPGRHICRVWVHSRTNWHIMMISKSTLLLGSRDLIQCAAVLECPWAAIFLTNLSTAFITWTRSSRSSTSVSNADREFYRSYQPDLTWDPQQVGYDKALVHWMFRQGLQSLLKRKLLPGEFRSACIVLRRYFCDPDFGLPLKPLPPRSLRDLVAMDLCDCIMPEVEEPEEVEDQLEEEALQAPEEKPILDQVTINKLLRPAEPLNASVICPLATEEVPCGVLKDEREKILRKHEAATLLQAHWRGAWARKCLTSLVTFTPDVLKVIMDNAFGNLEVLSELMNEFFLTYSGAKCAYSVASALSGVYGVNQHTGSAHIFPKCTWVPYFQGIFYCHGPVKVHFNLKSSLLYSSFAVYNNDLEAALPQACNSHKTFDFVPNIFGYTVIGHGSIPEPTNTNLEVNWQLTVLSSVEGFFHVCDNDMELCKEIPLSSSSKLHIDEIFIPNRNNILGGIQISVTKYEPVSFRAAATSPELEMEAILRTTNHGIMEDIGRCSGKGAIYWPYIWLEPMQQLNPHYAASKKRSYSQAHLNKSSESSAQLVKTVKAKRTAVSSAKSRSVTKFKSAPPEPKMYFIEVVTPKGWPLTLAQWKRVDEVRNSVETKVEVSPKKPTKEKVGSAKEKEKPSSPGPIALQQPQPGDAYVELECSIAVNGGAACKRNDERDLQFLMARRQWDAKDHGRNQMGAQIRKEFREEFLEALAQPPESPRTDDEETMYGEFEGEDEKKEERQPVQQGPTPATESGLLEMTLESEEEAKYLQMPEQLRDKFTPLYFVPLCTEEKLERESVIETPEMAATAKEARNYRLEAALCRMRELQEYNEMFVLGRQKRRCHLLEKFSVDSQWSPRLADVLDGRNEAIATETLNRNLSAIKKKQEPKKNK